MANDEPVVRNESQRDATADVNEPDQASVKLADEASETIDETPDINRGLLSTEDFASKALQLFPKLDINGDGSLDQEELIDAKSDRQYEGMDRQAIAALYGNKELLANQSNDQYGTETGISKEDLNAFYDNKMGMISADKNLDGLKFSDIAGKDGYISAGDIKSLLNGNSLSFSQREGLQYLLDHINELEENHDDEPGDENGGITLADYQAALSEALQDGALVESSLIQMLLLQNQRKKESMGLSEYRNGIDDFPE
jgi:hypothetical protein